MVVLGNSLPLWIQLVASVYLAIGFASALYIVYDIVRRHHRQNMPIMNIVWPITAWYLGPLALWTYWHIGHLNLVSQNCTDSTRTNEVLDGGTDDVPHHIVGTHESKYRKGKPFWETIFVSATHCGAGCTLGDVISEWSVFITGISIAGVALYASFIFDFTLAWLLGIIFQYIAIIQMQRMSVRKALAQAIKADTLSLVMFEIGLFGWMGFVSFVLMDKLYPISPVFWFMMQIGMILGFFTSYPANWWLVRKGIKHGM